MAGSLPNLLLNLLICTIVYQNTDRYIYKPNIPTDSRTNIQIPSTLNFSSYETIEFITSDKLKLHSYLIKQHEIYPNIYPTIIFLHGNVGNIGHRLQFIKVFMENIKVNVFLIEYRGFGLSQGKPTENGLYLDSQAAFDYILNRGHSSIHFNQSKITIFGRSLGGAIAIDLAAHSKYKHLINGLIIENTFTSIKDLTKIMFPLKIIDTIPNNCYKSLFDNVNKISGVISPILILNSLKDEIIPPWMSNTLYNNANSTKWKVIEKFPNCGHIGLWTCAANYWEIMERFINQINQQ